MRCIRCKFFTQLTSVLFTRLVGWPQRQLDDIWPDSGTWSSTDATDCIKQSSFIGSLEDRSPYEKFRKNTTAKKTIFRSGTDLLSLFILLLFLLGWPHQKSLTLSFQNRSGWNLAQMFFTQICIDWHSWILGLTSKYQDGHVSFHAAKYCAAT